MIARSLVTRAVAAGLAFALLGAAGTALAATDGESVDPVVVLAAPDDAVSDAAVADDPAPLVADDAPAGGVSVDEPVDPVEEVPPAEPVEPVALSAPAAAPLAEDTTPPVVNIQFPGGSSSARFIDGTTIDLRFTCLDYQSAVVRCEDSEGRRPGDLLTLRLRDVDPAAGGVVVTVTAENAAGLTATGTRVFEVVSEADVTVRTTATAVGGDLTWWNRSPVTLVLARQVDPGSAAGMLLAKLTTSTSWFGTNEPVIEWPFDEEGVHIVEHFAEATSGTTAIRSTTVRIDMTAPTIRISPDPFDRDEVPTYQPGELVNLDYTCTDELSGVDACTGDYAPGDVLPTDVPGTHEFQVVALDAAGNMETRVLRYIVAGEVPGDPDDPDDPGDPGDPADPDEPGDDEPAPAAAPRPAVLAATGGTLPLGGVAVAVLLLLGGALVTIRHLTRATARG